MEAFAHTVCELIFKSMCYDSFYLIKNNWKDFSCIVQLIKYQCLGKSFSLTAVRHRRHLGE